MCNKLPVCGAQDSLQRPYQIPRTVYVGDRAMLVLPLPNHTIAYDIEIDQGIITSPEIELHRIALESRGAGSRLALEFTGFSPGRFDISPFEAGGIRFSGLQIEISSILSEDGPQILSGISPPLSVPGTGIFIYGVLAALVLLLLAVLIAYRGRQYFRSGLFRRKQRRLIRLMVRIEKQIRKALVSEKNYRLILDTISRELRSFLSLFAGINCRTMTPGEFALLARREIFIRLPSESGTGFLKHFFTRCDELRFAGLEISAPDVHTLLAEIRSFLGALDRAVCENPEQEKSAA